MHSCEWKLYFAFQWQCITYKKYILVIFSPASTLMSDLGLTAPCADLVKSDQGVAVRKLNVQMAAIVRLAVLMLDLE